MNQRIVKHADRFFRIILIALVVLLGGQAMKTQATPQVTAGQPMLFVNTFQVNCASLTSVNDAYGKITDLGTFTVHSPGSWVELTFNGRIYVYQFFDLTSASFELRLNGSPSVRGLARAHLNYSEQGGDGVQVSITGFFSGLPAGEYTASIWARTYYGTADIAGVNPSCNANDVLIAKEYTPFGYTYLPLISR